jgi:hypothetical protein
MHLNLNSSIDDNLFFNFCFDILFEFIFFIFPLTNVVSLFQKFIMSPFFS